MGPELELGELIPVVLQKTNERKLEWEDVGSSFIARIGALTLELQSTKNGTLLILRNEENRAIDSATEEDVDSATAEKLEQLWQVARRRAFKTEETLQSLKEKLQKL